MSFMGCCVGAQKCYTFDKFINNREDIIGQRKSYGKALFSFYQDAISLRRRLGSIRSRNIDILHVSNDNRTIAFKRWSGNEQVIVIASFNNSPFHDGYVVQKDNLGIPDGFWKEVFNSDSAIYGGQNVGNYGASVLASQGRINAVIPATGFIVLVKQ